MKKPFHNLFSTCFKAPRADGAGDPHAASDVPTPRRSTMAAAAGMPLSRSADRVPAGNIERFHPNRRTGLDALRRSNSAGQQLQTSPPQETVSAQAAGAGLQPQSTASPRAGVVPDPAGAPREQAGPNGAHTKRNSGPMKSLRKAGTGIKHLATACVLGPGYSQHASKPVPDQGSTQLPQPWAELAGQDADDASGPSSRSSAQKVGRALKHIAAAWFVPARSYPFNKIWAPRQDALAQRPAAATPASGHDVEEEVFSTPHNSPVHDTAASRAAGHSPTTADANPFTGQPAHLDNPGESRVTRTPEPSLNRSLSIEMLSERLSVPDGTMGSTPPGAAIGPAVAMPVPDVAWDAPDDETVFFTPEESPTHEAVVSGSQLTHSHVPARAAHGERTAEAPAQPLNTASARASDVFSSAAQAVLSAGQQTAATTWQHVDARRLLTTGNDREMIDRLRAGDPETGRKSLASLREQVDGLKKELKEAVPDSNTADPASQKILKHFGDHIKHLDSVLRGLEKDRPWAVRAAIYGAMNVALPAMPVAVALKSGQGKFFAELAGMYGKTALMALGSMRSPIAADKHAYTDHFMQRHFLTLIQTAFHVVPSFYEPLKHLNEGAALNITAATLTTLTGVAAFLHEDIGRSVKRRIWNSPNPTLKNAWNKLSPGDSASFRRVLTTIEEAASKSYADISAESWRFKEEGKTISPYTSTQLKFVTDALLKITRDVQELRDPQQEAPAHAGNPQWRAKLALALLNVAIGSSVTMLMIPDWIGVGGNAGDTLVTSGIQFKGALQGDVSREDALDSFRSWSGLSVLMLGMLALNRAKGDFIEKGGATGVAVGATSLAILNAVLPGPIGHFLGSGIEKLMNMKSADFLAFTSRIGQGALDLFQQRAEATAPAASSVRIEELDGVGPRPATQSPDG